MIKQIKGEEGSDGYGIVERGEAPPDSFKNEYWGLVEGALEKVFGEDAFHAEQFRQEIDQTPPDTQTAFYHTDPFWVAADLAGRPQDSITVDEKRRYVRDVKNADPPADEQLGLIHPEQQP